MACRPIAYQIYSAREEASKNLDAVMEQLAGIGYDGVEFAGFYGHSAEDIKAMLERHGLIALSSHVPMQLIEADMFGVLSYHQQIGCKYIAIPFLDEKSRPGGPGFAHTLCMIQKFGTLCKAAGIELLYHNHDFEFVHISGQYGLDFLYDAIDSDILQTEIDVCWVKYFGEDPAAYIRKYVGRCPIVHLKDFEGEKSDIPVFELLGQQSKTKPEEMSFCFKPFGYGRQDAQEVVLAGIESGAEWFVVEQDIAAPYTPMEAAEMSMGTLRKLGVKQ